MAVILVDCFSWMKALLPLFHFVIYMPPSLYLPCYIEMIHLSKKQEEESRVTPNYVVWATRWVLGASIGAKGLGEKAKSWVEFSMHSSCGVWGASRRRCQVESSKEKSGRAIEFESCWSVGSIRSHEDGCDPWWQNGEWEEGMTVLRGTPTFTG